MHSKHSCSRSHCFIAPSQRSAFFLLLQASIFDDAAKYLTKATLKLSNDQKLSFYALFKQATIGPCNTPKPSILSMYDRAKWNAWNDLGKLSKDEAIVRYVAELEKVSPSWREHAGVRMTAAVV